VRVLFEFRSQDHAGAPESAFEQKFSAWPPVETSPRRFYLGEGGAGGDGADQSPSLR